MAIPLLAMPALFVSARVGLGGTDLSVSDVALAAAFGIALLLGERPYSRPMHALLWLNVIYQFLTLFTVIVNPFTANTVEWFHAWLLISGALVVGWSLGVAGYARRALSLMLFAALVIALGTFITAALQWAKGDFSDVYPAWPFPMHKNFAGTVMAFMAVVVYANPDWVRWSKGWRRLAFWALVAAILVTQSRQALIGLVVAVIVVAVRGRVSRYSRFMLLLAIPAIVLVIATVNDQIASQNRFNSFFQRLDWIREVYALWKHSPVFGHGLRYWYTDTTANFQPPQAEIEVLASAGVVGLIGFVVMWVGVIVVLWRVDRRFGTLALAVTLSRIVQAQFDLFWVASQVSIPFIIAGICLGAQAFERQREAVSAADPESAGDAITDLQPEAVFDEPGAPTLADDSAPPALRRRARRH
jgi:O-antigen ligase